ncbi:MAG: sigma-54-dependent Fis family transcriptional regulator [FCB group bacterium]|nr:sigma-54-dependent Fis family transcriptional regulator [FCB group bacterium]
MAHPHRIPIWLWVSQPDIKILNDCLLSGCDRWLLSSSSPKILYKLIQSALEQFGGFPIIDQKRFQLRKKFGINNLIGASTAMMNLYYTLERTINTDISVLIQGESGSGKELVARLVHLTSLRANEKMVSLNCAAVPEKLMESELFGYEKGAFTGANIHKKGKFEYAHKGTLFLDEIADMDLLMQSKILRVVELQEFERIGSNEPRKADVRIISASNKDLDQAIKINRFRLDLYYRINNFTILVPPLRERYGDFLPLMVYFLHRTNRKNRRNIQSFDLEILSILHSYSWPGNIRQFESFLTRAALFSEGSHLEAKTVAALMEPLQKMDTFSDGSSSKPRKISSIEDMERKAILNALTEVGGNITAAAKKLGLSRVTVWRKMERYKIKYEGPRA